MKVLLYAGPSPYRERVLEFSAPLLAAVATDLTLVTGGGAERDELLAETAAGLELPAHLPVRLLAMPGNAQEAILAAADADDYDLVIVGRLNPPLVRILPGPRPRSKVIAQRLEPSVLRVHGPARRIQRILLGSGGDYRTFENAQVTAQIAAPLGAEVTLLHVISQQPLFFEGFSERGDQTAEFLQSGTAEARILHEAALLLDHSGVPAQVLARSGPVLDEILSELRSGGYDLLVIGAHRATSALDRILLEDLSGDLLDLSPLPVLVIKPQ